jgi:hypothetical protein
MVHLPLLLAAAASLAALVAPATAATADPATTLTLNTGQEMPFINLGGTAQAVVPGNHYSNYSEFLRQGGRGLDTALIYTDPINKQIAAALKAHPEIPRSELFITSKVPCPVANKNPEYSCADAADCMKRNNALLQLPWTDLTLVHEPCATPEETIARWVQMEAALAAGVRCYARAKHLRPACKLRSGAATTIAYVRPCWCRAVPLHRCVAAPAAAAALCPDCAISGAASEILPHAALYLS